MTGLENNDGKGYYPFTDDCNRIENGIATTTTNNPSLGSGNNSGFNAMALGCKAQFESGYSAIVNRIHHWRFWRVDEERGVVWAHCIFDMSGAVPSIKLTNGQTVSMKGLFNVRAPRVRDVGDPEFGGVRAGADGSFGFSSRCIQLLHEFVDIFHLKTDVID